MDTLKCYNPPLLVWGFGAPIPSFPWPCHEFSGMGWGRGQAFQTFWGIFGDGDGLNIENNWGNFGDGNRF